MGKIAALITHTHPETVAEAVKQTAEAAQDHGWLLQTTSELAVTPGIEAVEELPKNPDLCLVLGGDGTTLYALRAYAESSVPVFAINHGTVGFLSTAERQDFPKALEASFQGDFETIGLPGLKISDKIALNDVAFSRRPHGRIAELYYSVADEVIGKVRCDGLVIATPTGSTGYNLANNGPILAWGVGGYVISYVSPHTLTARSLVVAPDEILTVGNTINRTAVDLAIDGEHVGELASGEELTISFAPNVSRLAQIPGQNFYRRISEKFGHLAN